MKSGCPSTLSAAAPFALDAALSNHNTRLFAKSETHSRPEEVTFTPRGLFKADFVVAAVAVMKPLWPSTLEAFAPSLEIVAAEA